MLIDVQFGGYVVLLGTENNPLPNKQFITLLFWCIYSEHLEQVDEPIANPTKLFRVQRIKPTKGRPYWERRTLVELGIGQSVS